MRNLLVVIDTKRNTVNGSRWHLVQTTFASVEADDDATAVRTLCTNLAAYGPGWNADVRVRSYPNVPKADVLTTDLEQVEPSATFIYPQR